jgi:hypothetical protein
MSLRDHFPACSWIGHALTGSTARRAYVTIATLLLLATTVVRAYSFILTRRIQAVISGLSTLRIDEATEAEVGRVSPYLVRNNEDRIVTRNVELGDVDTGVEIYYYASMSNQLNWMSFENFAGRISNVRFNKHDNHPRGWVFTLADWLGYRYISFRAAVVLLDGRVSSIRYAIADRLVFPEVIGDIISVKSIHSRWGPNESGFSVSSAYDEDPKFLVRGDDQGLAVLFTPEASPALKSHAFKVHLACFWNLFGCRHPRQIAPLLWQDKNSIEIATGARLNGIERCPDRILAGRAKYLPDMDVVLVEPTGFKHENKNEQELGVDNRLANYKLIEVLRGRASKPLELINGISMPRDYRRSLPDMGLELAKSGDRMLVFANLYFDTCRVVQAKPSTLSAVRNAIPASRRAEDELVTGLQ